jgi:carbonic anhydrase
LNYQIFEHNKTSGLAFQWSLIEFNVGGCKYSTFLLLSADSASFSYDDSQFNGPSNWHKINKDCKGRRQSPINIDTRYVMKASYCNPVKIFNTNLPTATIDLVNTGHGASMDFNFQYASDVHIFGGPLRQPYTLKSFHIHWPSEHTLDGRRFAAEIHLVHWNEKYRDFITAKTKFDGLAVLGFFFEIDDNSKENSYLKLFQKVRLDNQKITETNEVVRLEDVIGKDSDLNVYSYLGSLTTPDCSENVLWMISNRTLKIKTSELNELKRIQFDTGFNIDKNFRPLQRLLDRKVMFYTH